MAEPPTDPSTSSSLFEVPTHSPTTGPHMDFESNLQPAPSSIMARVLNVTDLAALMRVLGIAAHYAYNLGMQLGLHPNLVHTLEKQALGDPVKFLSLILENRLIDCPTPITLQGLHNAICKPPIDDEELAWSLQCHFE